MTSYVENETDVIFAFPVEETVNRVMEAVLDSEGCPYEASVSVLLTDDEGIRMFNKEYRDMDKATDVLSFPNVSYEEPSMFEGLEDVAADCFDPDSGELVLGDIIISVDKVRSQAESYGHSELREFAFLVAHSMFHLCGYDHMEEEEAAVMEEKQKTILDILNITRD
ncbi:putative rRNA maturation factor [Kineothrix alysoides]|uniref:Endoribonuclease YbeY n=1 Tax=Kineothrix alysoides TaxID=1469948 RepID=A0A4R1R386_9FIRM|nr:rRNA maturation RNase YbeY [Kineothrix alysoides]TCL59881.1 putative rRNA maturation factor [Kineothrix alysoides]